MRHCYLAEQSAAVRDANEFDTIWINDGRSIDHHMHVVFMNYRDMFLDFDEFCRAVEDLTKTDTTAKRFAARRVMQLANRLPGVSQWHQRNG